jgi:hypothetical protein
MNFLQKCVRDEDGGYRWIERVVIEDAGLMQAIAASPALKIIVRRCAARGIKVGLA